jgi:hypothetical protein
MTIQPHDSHPPFFHFLITFIMTTTSFQPRHTLEPHLSSIVLDVAQGKRIFAALPLALWPRKQTTLATRGTARARHDQPTRTASRVRRSRLTAPARLLKPKPCEHPRSLLAWSRRFLRPPSPRSLRRRTRVGFRSSKVVSSRPPAARPAPRFARASRSSALSFRSRRAPRVSPARLFPASVFFFAAVAARLGRLAGRGLAGPADPLPPRPFRGRRFGGLPSVARLRSRAASGSRRLLLAPGRSSLDGARSARRSIAPSPRRSLRRCASRFPSRAGPGPFCSASFSPCPVPGWAHLPPASLVGSAAGRRTPNPSTHTSRTANSSRRPAEMTSSRRRDGDVPVLLLIATGKIAGS